MFCPKCGADNKEDLAYCRSCGEDLKIVSQAMKKHLPIALVSKLDAAIEKKNERLRRDAILSGLTGIVLLVSTIFVPVRGDFFSLFNIIFFIFGIFSFFVSGLKFLTYRRSLELTEKRAFNTSSGIEPLPLDNLRIEKLPIETGATTNKLPAVNSSQSAPVYCPRCGVKNPEPLLYCRDCGTSLDFSFKPQGMERYLPVSLVKKLDEWVAKNEATDYKPRYKSGWTLLIVAIIFLVNAIMQGFLGGNWGNAVFYLVIGFTLVIGGGWDLIAYRRNLEKEGKSIDESTPSFIDELVTFFSRTWKIILMLLALPLIPFVLTYFGIASGVFWGSFPLLAGIIFIALILKFRQNRRLETSEQLLDENLPTKELPPADTFPLESPISVTEERTKMFEPAFRKGKK